MEETKLGLTTENVTRIMAQATEKIDGMVALLMALQRATLAGGSGESVYATRGLRRL